MTWNWVWLLVFYCCSSFLLERYTVARRKKHKGCAVCKGPKQAVLQLSVPTLLDNLVGSSFLYERPVSVPLCLTCHEHVLELPTEYVLEEFVT